MGFGGVLGFGIDWELGRRLIMKRVNVVAMALFIVAGGGSAMAHEGDVGVVAIDGRLTTGIVVENATGAAFVLPGQRVFLAELDADGFAADPGLFGSRITSETGPLTLGADTSIGFVIRGPLTAWNGTEFVSTSNRMRLEFANGNLQATTPVTNTNVSGFSLPLGAEFDEHWDFFLQGASASDAPVAGIFALELALTGSGGLRESLPFWMIFNFGADEAAHEAAEGYAEAVLVPAPGAAVLVLGGAGVMGWRRRRGG